MNRAQPFVRGFSALLLSAAAVQVHAEGATTDRYEAFANGTVRDHQTGALWANKDNGGDIDWASAQAHCQALGAGWGLPGKDQLSAMYMTDPARGQDCIGRLTCHLTPLIEMSGLTPWTSQSNGPQEAWYVYLADGQAYAYKSSSTEGKRALCMRAE